MIRKKIIFIDEEGSEYECRSTIKKKIKLDRTAGVLTAIKNADLNFALEGYHTEEVKIPDGITTLIVTTCSNVYWIRYYGRGEYEVHFMKDGYKEGTIQYKSEGKYTLFWFVNKKRIKISDYYFVKW